MSRLSRARRALSSELGGPLASGLILALLLPFLDREARAEIKDLSAFDGDPQSPVTQGLLVAPFLPLFERDGRGLSLGARISEVLGKALNKLAKELDGGGKGLPRAEVAASLFFLLLIDMALADHGGTRLIRDLFERGLDDGDAAADTMRLALAESDTAGFAAETAGLQAGDQTAAGLPGGGPAQAEPLIAGLAQDPALESPIGSGPGPSLEDDAAAAHAEPEEAGDAATEVAVAEARDGRAEPPANLQDLARIAEAAGPEGLLTALATDGPTGAGASPGADGSTMAFVMGKRFELVEGRADDHWAALLQNLLADDGDEFLFDDGEGAPPLPGYWSVAEANEAEGPAVTLGELIEGAEEDSLLYELIGQSGAVEAQMAVEMAPQIREQIAESFAEPLDGEIVNDVQTDVS